MSVLPDQLIPAPHDGCPRQTPSSDIPHFLSAQALRFSMGEVDGYQCSLTEDDKKLALEELNEVPSERLSAVNTFREWIIQQPHIKCPTDTEYLLRFLRTSKFSQLRARETLVGFLTMKTQLPQWYTEIDMTNPRIVAFLKTGYALPLGWDSRGSYCLMFREGSLETENKSFGPNDIFQAILGMIFHILSSERVMVNGVRYFMDMTGFEMKHITYWGMDTIKTSMKMYHGNFFGRYKGFHNYNAGNVFETLMAAIAPLIPKKMRDRMHVHGNMEEVYKYIPMAILPDEFLPDDYEGPSGGSIQSIADKLVQDLTEASVVKKILYETRAEWKIDASKKPSDVPTESFRKLQVD